MVSGAVLAGGRSRRMGTDKALIRLGGSTLLERSIRTLRSVVTDVVVAGGDAGRYTSSGVPCLGDAIPEAGPLAGILAALDAARGDAVLVIACDLPFVTSSLMSALLSTDPASPIVVATSGDIIQPLCARYAVSLKHDLRAFLTAGNRRVMEFVSAHQHTYLEIGTDHPLYDPFLLSNLNSADDIRSVEKIMLQRIQTERDAREPHT
jgi:molybdenum cofactor guanylyltransferase